MLYIGIYYLFIYFCYWVLYVIILLGITNTTFVEIGKMKFVEYSFKNS